MLRYRLLVHPELDIRTIFSRTSVQSLVFLFFLVAHIRIPTY